jgi:hypothetical protein
MPLTLHLLLFDYIVGAEKKGGVAILTVITKKSIWQSQMATTIRDSVNQPQ